MVHFRDIVDVERWRSIQEHFSSVLGVTFRTVDEQGIFLVEPAGNISVCDEIIKKSNGRLQCNWCLPYSLEEAAADWRQGYQCPLGLYHFVIPLKIKEKTLAYLIIGPVMLGKFRRTQEYIEKAQQLGIEEESFLNLLREIRCFTFSGMRSVTELLYEIGLYFCETGFQRLKLEEDIRSHTLPLLSRFNDFYVEKLLDSLLEVSFNFTEADRGSILLFDERGEELYIKASKGLSPKVVEQTRLGRGEGIAGIVAQEGDPLFINDSITDERLRKEMKNPLLRYAISLPIKVSQKIVGVLNLATSKKESDKFTAQSFETIDTLTRLVQTTLAGIVQEAA